MSSPPPGAKTMEFVGKNKDTYAYRAQGECYEVDQVNYHAFEVYKVINDERLLVAKKVSDKPHHALMSFLDE